MKTPEISPSHDEHSSSTDAESIFPSLRCCCEPNSSNFSQSVSALISFFEVEDLPFHISRIARTRLSVSIVFSQEFAIYLGHNTGRVDAPSLHSHKPSTCSDFSHLSMPFPPKTSAASSCGKFSFWVRLVILTPKDQRESMEF